MANGYYHRTFEIDERVVVSRDVVGLDGVVVSRDVVGLDGVMGTVVGVVSESFVDTYIVLLDEPRVFNLGGNQDAKWQSKPWRAIATQGTQLRLV